MCVVSNRQCLKSFWHISLCTQHSSFATTVNKISQSTQHCLQRIPYFFKAENKTMQNAVALTKIIKGTRVPPSGLGKYCL